MVHAVYKRFLLIVHMLLHYSGNMKGAFEARAAGLLPICNRTDCMGTHNLFRLHYDDVIMGGMVSQITSLTIVYSIVYSSTDQRKHQSSASLAFVWGIHRDRWIPPTKGQLRGKCFHLMTSSCEQRILNVANSLQQCHITDDILARVTSTTPGMVFRGRCLMTADARYIWPC